MLSLLGGRLRKMMFVGCMAPTIAPILQSSIHRFVTYPVGECLNDTSSPALSASQHMHSETCLSFTFGLYEHLIWTGMCLRSRLYQHPGQTVHSPKCTAAFRCPPRQLTLLW
jgi:hypothetical protein